VTEETLVRARGGDENAFRELTDPYRHELQLHIYRIVGSVQEAEDMLQETLLAAWRSLAGFEGRASLRAWLYRIATNRSLDALRASRRRPEEARMTHLTSFWKGSPTRRLVQRRATRPARESRWPSSPVSSICHRSSARCWYCATSSATAPER